ncbi:hypothetical protein E2C01_092813 [Portunus trituberculatus]|uniref:Uncharacterized protein n=1 Tax=Portunus trituberculatus TaxID=210409 RepID=A0A5B7JSE9_PORTR|nr:hypothetical protein [Portunus trituberculatus]
MLCQHTGVRLDNADLLLLPTLPPWKQSTTTFKYNWLPGKKAVVDEVEFYQQFRALVADLPPSLH